MKIYYVENKSWRCNHPRFEERTVENIQNEAKLATRGIKPVSIPSK